MLRIFILKKSRVKLEGGENPEHNRVKNFVYHLTLVSKVSIPNLRPLGPPLHVEKFVWWVGV